MRLGSSLTKTGGLLQAASLSKDLSIIDSIPQATGLSIPRSSSGEDGENYRAIERAIVFFRGEISITAFPSNSRSYFIANLSLAVYESYLEQFNL